MALPPRFRCTRCLGLVPAPFAGMGCTCAASEPPAPAANEQATAPGYKVSPPAPAGWETLTNVR